MKTIEELARELYSVDNAKYSPWECITIVDKKSWIKLAQHVQRLLIEAKIEALDNLCFPGEWKIATAIKINGVIDTAIHELQSELEK